MKILRSKSEWISEPCKSCNILVHCGGCRALAKEECGNMEAPDRVSERSMEG